MRWTTCFLPLLISMTSSIGIVTSKIFSSMFIDEMRLFKVRLHLVLVAGVGVHDEPVAGLEDASGRRRGGALLALLAFGLGLVRFRLGDRHGNLDIGVDRGALGCFRGRARRSGGLGQHLLDVGRDARGVLLLIPVDRSIHRGRWVLDGGFLGGDRLLCRSRGHIFGFVDRRGFGSWFGLGRSRFWLGPGRHGLGFGR